MNSQNISACIITYNEQENIRLCLESLSWADEIVVVDSGSIDNTQSICNEFGCRFIHHDWEGYARQKNFALRQCQFAWIISIDADEVITKECADEILSVIKSTDADIYSIPRLNYFLGKWMRHGGWYPDRQIRLFRNGCGEFKIVPIHESFQPYDKDAKTAYLINPMQHYTYKSVSDFIKKTEIYSTLDAERIVNQGKSPKFITAALLLSFPLKFVEVYVYKSGWRDGLHGFIAAMLLSARVFLRTVKIWE
jgi:glycosyltransferase involved in cell wall biosynthesis